VTQLPPAMDGAFGRRLQARVPLAPLTTFRVGGPADWLLETQTADEMLLALRLAYAGGIPVTLLGGGSNVLVSDAGIRGLVLRARGGEIREIGDALVRADAPVTINGLVRWTIHHGRAGLEAWAGTPGTVGGAIYGNAHFAGRLIGELIASVRLATRAGETRDVPASEMAFAYDHSRLHESGELALSADFHVSRGDPAVLRSVARASLAFRKRTQPLDTPSAGCVFQNPQRGVDTVPDGVPWSAGALVDRAGLKGAFLDGARVSLTHGNFIVNEGTASAAAIRNLIDRCKQSVRERFGVALREEIVYLGEW
jgi:UDP-N-acetylmuramate dehydrogenase